MRARLSADRKDFALDVTFRGGGAKYVVMARALENRSDGELLRATVGGRPDAFAAFYRRYVPRLSGLLMRQTRDREVTADLTSEVFAAVLLSAERFRGTGADSAWPWVCGIAQNKLRESWRRGQVEDRARRRLCLEPEVLDDAGLARVEQMDAQTEVLALLEGLPKRQREAVRKHVLEERGYADIAAELRCSEMVVRQQVSRGLTKLRVQMDGAGS
jgi:RNA polymerase sigma factor (sigma-70 family)